MKYMIVAAILVSSITPLALGYDQDAKNQKDESEDRPNLPAVELSDLPILDLSYGQPVLRTLTQDELTRTRNHLVEQRAKADPTERDLINGDCYNNSGHWAGIYGPNISGRPYDNDLYMVPPGYKSPDAWDCDGFYIPEDVSVRMITLAVTLYQHGPGAVKINSAQWGTLESTGPLSRQISASVLEWIGPGNLTNWYRPGFPQQDLDNLGDTWRPKPPASR